MIGTDDEKDGGGGRRISGSACISLQKSLSRPERVKNVALVSPLAAAEIAGLFKSQAASLVESAVGLLGFHRLVFAADTTL